MDFSTLDTQAHANQTYRFEILHPVTEEPMGAFIDVYGSESDAVKKHANQQLRQLQKREFENARSRKPAYTDLDELRDGMRQNALARLAGWENIKWEKTDLPFTPENAKKLLTACPWLCEQIIKQSDDLGNFLPPPSVN